MIEVGKYAFIIICFAILVWSIVKIERIYQFPTFMASIFFMFLFPQINALIQTPGGVSDTMIERVVIMACLCVAMCWIGYQASPNHKLINLLNVPIDEKKLTIAASLLTILGLIFSFATRQASQTIQAGAQWTGSATIFAFFAQLSVLGFAIFVMLSLQRFTNFRLLGVIAAGSPLWQSIVLNGRRQPTVTFLILIGMTIWFVKRWSPPRWTVIPITFLGVYLIPLYGQLRGQLWTLLLNGEWESLNTQSEQMMITMDSGGILELRNAAFAMDYATLFGQYEYGGAYWNGFVFQYIPGQLLGYDLKSSLMLPVQSFSSLDYYNYDFPLGTTWTAVGDTYLQFGFFGCIVLALMAMLFKNLWLASMRYGSQIAFLLMANLASPAMVSVSHGTVRFLQEGIFNVLVIFLLAKFCKRNNFVNLHS